MQLRWHRQVIKDVILNKVREIDGLNWKGGGQCEMMNSGHTGEPDNKFDVEKERK